MLLMPMTFPPSFSTAYDFTESLLIRSSRIYIWIGVIRRECTPFRGLHLNGFTCTLAPPSLMWGPIIMIYKCVVDKLVQMSNGEIWFKKNSEKRQTSHSENATWASLRIHDQSCHAVVFAETLHGIFLCFHIHMELFSVTSIRRFILLALFYALWFQFGPEIGTECLSEL